MTKISRPIIEAMATTQEEIITVEGGSTVEVDIMRVAFKTILLEDPNVGYAIKRIILVRTVLINTELT